MTQTVAHKPTQPSKTIATCANCKYFDDFQERSGRGWCNIFDTVARKHHPKTQDCHWAIASHEKGLVVEELPPYPYEIGQLVKIIDPNEADRSQWKTYVVVGRRYNSGRYRSISAYLSETSWHFALKAIEETPQTSSEIWVAQDRVYSLAGTKNINVTGEF